MKGFKYNLKEEFMKKKVLSCFMLLLFCMGINFVFGDSDYDWIQIEPPNKPSPGRMGHKMVYDSLREVVVLFGGEYDNDCEMNDTWEFDGTTWVQKFPTTVPRTRDFFGMAYDSDRNVTVVFGGEDWPASLNDTWEWDGNNWTQIHTANRPGTRAHINMAYDKKRKQIVLFGGWQWYNTLGDTWVYDGVDWTRKYPATSPPRTQNNLLVYDEKREVVVLFGGSIHNQGIVYDDTWEWDGENWEERYPVDFPSPREEPCGTYDSINGKVILYGGGGEADTWAYDGSNWEFIPTDNSPGSRGHASMAYQKKNNTIVLFGGYQDGFTDHHWELFLGTHCVFGPENQPLTFTRLKGKPINETFEWESCGGQGLLKINNNRVSSAYVYLNDTLVTGPSDFNQNIDYLEFNVNLLEGTNILEVELRGKPGGMLEISFE